MRRQFCYMLFSICFTSFTQVYGSYNGPKNPVILVPGDGGSQFEARLNKPSVIHFWCDQKAEWFPLWLNLELMTPLTLECFIDNMRLVYNNVTHTTSDAPGVETRQPGFGNTSSVEWLDSSQLGPTWYYHYVVENLVKKLNYTRNHDVRGAPYDFRKSPNELGGFLDNLGSLIEETYTMTGNRRVVVIGHSMGTLCLLYLLNHRSQMWKDTYIESFVAISGPWGGAVKTLRLMAAGDNLGVFVLNSLTARREQRSMTSSAWLMPFDTFWKSDEVLVTGPLGNYTVNDYKRLFADLNFTDGWLMRQDTELLTKKLTHPGVDVYCVHGVGLKTPESIHFTKKTWPDSQPETVFGDGDKTVNLRSLHGCLRWGSTKGKYKFDHHEIPNAEHIGILKTPELQSYLQKILQN